VTNEELVMLHYDGELDPERTREVERLLARDPEARRLLEQLQRVGSLLRAADAARAPKVDLTPRILERVFGSEMGERRAALSPSRKKEHLVPRLAWGAAALAAAAAVGVMLGRSPSEHVPGVASRAHSTQTTAAVARSESIDSDAQEGTVSVETVDFGASQGAIFLVPGAEKSMLVVWTLDDETETAREIDL
jgi:anti-sigma factor RsiW